MRKRSFLLFGIGVVAISGACSAPVPPKTTFLTSFSMTDVIKRSYGQADHQVQQRVLGGTAGSAVSSGAGHHCFDSAELSISSGDESQFLLGVKREMRQQLEHSGGKIVDEGSGDSDYSIGYTDGKITGWIDILGMRGAGDRYKLVIIITEK